MYIYIYIYIYICCALVGVNNNLYKMQGTNIKILIRLLCKFVSLWNECYLYSVTSAAHIQVYVQIKTNDNSVVSKLRITEIFHLILSLVTSLNALQLANCSSSRYQLTPSFLRNALRETGHTGCPRRNVPNFGRVFLMLNYTDITQNTYIQS